jgi:hypothetical protein
MTLLEAAAVFRWLDRQALEIDEPLMQYNQLKSALPMTTR